MKIKTSELTGAALDWAVAKCEGYRLTCDSINFLVERAGMLTILGRSMLHGSQIGYSPSTDWAQAGPIIEREEITTVKCNDLYFPHGNEKGMHWEPLYRSHTVRVTQYGPTYLIAAMRCYVSSKLGEEVEVPDELK